MNKNLFPLIALMFLSTSCVGLLGFEEEPNEADAFVGTYSISASANVVWGRASYSYTDNGTLYIHKVSATTIRTSGFFSTTGRVINNYIYFDPNYSSDAEGYINEVYGPGVLTGNLLTFSSNGTGQIRYNGVVEPWSRSSTYTATKIR